MSWLPVKKNNMENRRSLSVGSLVIICRIYTLLSKLNFQSIEEHEKYFGLGTSIGRSKKVIFQVIQDRVSKKVKGWKERYMSRVGIEVLLKYVAQAILPMLCSVFKFLRVW